MAATHTHSYVWPSGIGETPCSERFFDMMIRRNELWSQAQELGGTDNLEPALYDEFCRLENDTGIMSLDPAHRGPPVRY